MDRSDEALIAAHGHGDPAAFGELLRRHGPAVFGYLVRMNRSREQAEDLFQDTFRRVHEQAATFRGRGSFRGSFRAWLFAIAANLAVDACRKQRRDPSPGRLDALTDCPHSSSRAPGPAIAPAATKASQPVDQAIVAERRARVWQVLDRLPPRQ
jgi:RNA polymerase sigma-70 factor (ECF subfamily)